MSLECFLKLWTLPVTLPSDSFLLPKRIPLGKENPSGLIIFMFWKLDPFSYEPGAIYVLFLNSVMRAWSKALTLHFMPKYCQQKRIFADAFYWPLKPRLQCLQVWASLPDYFSVIAGSFVKSLYSQIKFLKIWLRRSLTSGSPVRHFMAVRFIAGKETGRTSVKGWCQYVWSVLL